MYSVRKTKVRACEVYSKMVHDKVTCCSNSVCVCVLPRHLPLFLLFFRTFFVVCVDCIKSQHTKRNVIDHDKWRINKGCMMQDVKTDAAYNVVYWWL